MSIRKAEPFIVVIVVLIVIILFYNGMIGINPKQVIVIIAQGSGNNPHLGFEPAVITVVIGINNTVTWRNIDTDWHTAYSNIPEFNSGLIQSGQSFTHTFDRAGTFPYYCDPHPWMTGIVIVKSSTGVGMIQSNIGSDGPLQATGSYNVGLKATIALVLASTCVVDTHVPELSDP